MRPYLLLYKSDQTERFALDLLRDDERLLGSPNGVPEASSAFPPHGMPEATVADDPTAVPHDDVSGVPATAESLPGRIWEAVRGRRFSRV
jgi:hypothetical protein